MQKIPSTIRNPTLDIKLASAGTQVTLDISNKLCLGSFVKVNTFKRPNRPENCGVPGILMGILNR
jgi:hypothetical protein